MSSGFLDALDDELGLPTGAVAVGEVPCDSRSPTSRKLPVRHLTDCSWIAGRDARGCTCARAHFLASCTDEEATTFARQNPLLLRVDVAEASWTTRRTPSAGHRGRTRVRLRSVG